MLEQLVVVDYQEGAGGEYMANWLSAHWGHDLAENMQTHPNWLQKWFNSHRLISHDWSENFGQYLQQFLQICAEQKVTQIAVSYHLYHYPEQIQTFVAAVPTRFVRINCTGFEQKVHEDFVTKVRDRPLTKQDWPEIKFILQNQSLQHRSLCMDLFRRGQLTYRTLIACNIQPDTRCLPSRDIEIWYRDFFVDFDRTPQAYQKLCAELAIEPQPQLLQCLIERNKKNLSNNL